MKRLPSGDDHVAERGRRGLTIPESCSRFALAASQRDSALVKRLRDSGPLRVQYRIQFLDRSANVIHEWSATGQSVAGVVALVVDAHWPKNGMSRCLLKFSKRSLRIEIYAASAI